LAERNPLRPIATVDTCSVVCAFVIRVNPASADIEAVGRYPRVCCCAPCCGAAAADRRPPTVQQSIDISWQPGPRQQTRGLGPDLQNILRQSYDYLAAAAAAAAEVRLPYDNAKLTIDLRRTSNLSNIRKTQR